MNYYSTKRISPEVALKEAVLKGLPDDNGLYMPKAIPKLDVSVLQKSHQMSFQDIAFEMACCLIEPDVPRAKLEEIINDAFNFEIPLTQLDANIHILELFHGPTHAFKDFGARFMARLMAYFLKDNNTDVNILVATSGDTGSAVAQGFLGVDGVKVTLLYPSGKVSDLQEKQLTTCGQNITALEVDGTFDDCQKMVKEAFLNQELNKKFYLTSANSINIARLIPQSFYYLYAWSRLKESNENIVFSVPSGNFGNLCGGLLAREMRMPVDHFVAATNINKIVPEYLESGLFNPKPSTQTLANAMDVGNPSNFPRLKALLGDDVSDIRNHIFGTYYTDDQTLDVISEVYDNFDYFICPHSAIGYQGLKHYLNDKPGSVGISLATAHPAKFIDTVERATGSDFAMPKTLEEVMSKPKQSIKIGNNFQNLRDYLISD
ncbi:MAG: threonine synthase [Cyclobacteriaceae bacterium]